ncbi:MAG: sigma-70 family RNA polymerase sigma factor [Polyangiaceae bacterium]|nr:sigma-70 family RNA polymerase sigma factor [Polyangiaceae bacterium]NUQ78135.1 sigma-70 family RNA polymerase sigma factor [Polyangiaceae bacterium]
MVSAAIDPKLGQGEGASTSASPSIAAPPQAPKASAARAGAIESIEALYRKHHRLVFHLGLRYGQGDVAWAEDITQEVFVHLFDVIGGLCDLDDMEGWLYRATTNRCLNRLRRDRFLALAPVRWLLGEQQREPLAPEALAIARDDLRRVLGALGTLPPKEQIAFAMYYLDGKEQDEIGRLLGCSKSYVCKLIQRGVGKMRALGMEVSNGTSG